MWLDQSMQWLGAPSGKRGRSPTFSVAAIQFCLSIKCLFGQPLRQALSMVQSLLQLAKLDWPVPDFSTVCRRQETLQVELSYQRTKSPLQLLVDSPGIKFLGEGEWKRKKHGAECRREWRKVHLGIDAPMLPELLAQVPGDEPIASVCADGAYDTRGCLEANTQRQAMALLPPRKNASYWKKSGHGSAHRNEAIRVCQRLRRSIWKKWSVYHRRSLVQTKMHCLKRLGERVTAQTFERQVVELHVRVALHNQFSQIGRPQTVPMAAVAQARLGWGSCRLHLDLCNKAIALN